MTEIPFVLDYTCDSVRFKIHWAPRTIVMEVFDSDNDDGSPEDIATEDLTLKMGWLSNQLLGAYPHEFLKYVADAYRGGFVSLEAVILSFYAGAYRPKEVR